MFRMISEKECLDVLKNLDVNKPTGPSTIPAWALKDGLTELYPHLTFIINAFIKENKFPSSLKAAEVIPIYKKDDRLEPTNYRPISITPVLSKVFERILLNQINEYLSKNSIMSNIQFGFRKQFSTNDALLYITETFRKELDAGNMTAVAFLDLSKAFDSIDHTILRKKLGILGFGVESLNLIDSFLHNRKQRVRLGETLSEWYEINQGVPQGTILGPLLFTLYVNDMHSTVKHCQIIQYADDTCLFICGKKSEDLIKTLKEDAENLIKFFGSHKLMINIGKTNFMIIRKKGQNNAVENLTVTICNKTIEQVAHAKYLGIFIDNNLNFEKQCKAVLRKMAAGIKTINHISSVIPLKTRILLLHSLVLSHFNYSCLLFTGLTETYFNKLERNFSWGLKVCYNKQKRSGNTVLHLKSNLPPLRFQLKSKLTLSLWKLKNDNWEAFKYLPFPNNITTTNPRTLKVSLNHVGKTKYAKQSFLSCAIKEWNTLLPTVNDSIHFKKTKTFVKEHYNNAYKQLPHDRRFGTSWEAIPHR